MSNIKKIVIRGASGYGPGDEAYEDKITITPDSISYKYHKVFAESEKDNKKWKYKSDSKYFKEWYEAVCEYVEEQLGNEIECFCTDVGGVGFVVTYENNSRRHEWYSVPTDFFGDLFRLIKLMVPKGEEVPYVLMTNEDYHDNYEIETGRYKHFKGKEYEVIGMAKNTETKEDMVIYKALYGDGATWIRPAAMWDETICRNGKVYRRFTKIDD